MIPAVKTYSMLERLKRPDFGIHDARALSSVERLHRHEYFQVQLHVEGKAEHQVGEDARWTLDRPAGHHHRHGTERMGGHGPAAGIAAMRPTTSLLSVAVSVPGGPATM